MVSSAQLKADHFLKHMTGIALQAKMRDNNPLEVAEEIFKRFSTATRADKAKLASELNRVYFEIQFISQTAAKLSPALQSTAARVFYLYGRTLNMHGNEEAARQMLHLSLEVQLRGLQTPLLIPGESRSLDVLAKKLSAVNPDFKSLQELLDNQIHPSILDSEDRTFMLGSTLHWLGHSFQCIERFSSSDNLPHFQKIYNLAKNVLGRFPSRDFRDEIGRIILHSEPLMAVLDKPNDHQNLVVALGRVIVHVGEGEEEHSIHDNELEAQYYDKSAGIDFASQVGKPINHFLSVKLAFGIAQATEGFDPQIKACILYNFIHFGIECLKNEDIVPSKQELLKVMTDLMALIKGLDYNHPNHAAFALKVAEAHHYFGNDKGAGEHLQLAEDIAKMHPESSSEILEDIKDVKAEMAPKGPAAAAAIEVTFNSVADAAGCVIS